MCDLEMHVCYVNTAFVINSKPLMVFSRGAASFQRYMCVVKHGRMLTIVKLL